MQFNIRFYATAVGTKPLLLFLSELRAAEPLLHKLLVAGIKRLEQSEYHGLPLTEQRSSHYDVLELHVGSPNIARVFFFFGKQQEIILTNGYVEKTQRVDAAQLREALTYKKDWEKRYP